MLAPNCVVEELKGKQLVQLWQVQLRAELFPRCGVVQQSKVTADDGYFAAWRTGCDTARFEAPKQSRKWGEGCFSPS